MRAADWAGLHIMLAKFAKSNSFHSQEAGTSTARDGPAKAQAISSYRIGLATEHTKAHTWRRFVNQPR